MQTPVGNPPLRPPRFALPRCTDILVKYFPAETYAHNLHHLTSLSFIHFHNGSGVWEASQYFIRFHD